MQIPENKASLHPFLTSKLDVGRLDCPYCATKALPASSTMSMTGRYRTFALTCASCMRDTVFVHCMKSLGVNPNVDSNWEWVKRVHPLEGKSPRIFAATNSVYIADYVEACGTLAVSPKSSAAMSRRCLQSVLRDQGYASRDLAAQVDALLKERDPNKVLPMYLRQSVDAIRNLGNFAAHRINDRTTLEIIDVEPGEAEWCVELMEQLFEHYFEKPAVEATKRDALNAKLAAAGKPPVKAP